MFTKAILEININMNNRQFENVGVLKKPISGWQMIFKSLRHHRKIRFGIHRLIEQVESEDKYELEDFEKNTLYKSVAKLLSTYDGKRETKDAIKKLGDFSR